MHYWPLFTTYSLPFGIAQGELLSPCSLLFTPYSLLTTRPFFLESLSSYPLRYHQIDINFKRFLKQYPRDYYH